MTGPTYQFGEFQLDAARFELLRNGHSLRLERKPLELLILLASSEGRLVTRSEIAGHLWDKEVFVDTEHGINTAIRKIRAALHDDPEKPRFLQTVTRMGYRFLAPVSTSEEVAPAAASSTASPAAPVAVPAPPLPSSAAPFARRWLVPVLAGTATCALLAVLAVLASVAYRGRTSLPEVRYQQLTDLTDSAVAPALSPDGHTLAFIRGLDSFGSTGPIYIKALPDGEVRQVTEDKRPKYGLAFSPDGSQIAYTVFDLHSLATYAVSVFGGDPHLFLNNAAGLSWLDPHRLLFSEARSGIHLGVVTGTATGGAQEDIYFPAHQRGMAHYALPSPDHEWLLVVEMDKNGDWAPCRVVALTGQHGNRPVGPRGPCTAAAWSRDGRCMYFTASVDGRSHLWRQRFPDGAPQQLTFGASEEEGLAVEPSGNSLITSIGSSEGALWVHDDAGERALTSEGDVVTYPAPPQFRQNDSVLYFLLRRGDGQAGATLWRSDTRTGRGETVLPGVTMLDYDVSRDGTQIVFSSAAPDGSEELWLAPTDRTHPAVRLGVRDGVLPHFGAAGQIVYQAAEQNTNYLEQIRPDGSGRSKVVPFPISQLEGMSPGGRWAVATISESPASTRPSVVAIPVDGSSPRRICEGFCVTDWASDGSSLVVTTEFPSSNSPGRSLVIPIGRSESIPETPATDSGFLITPGAVVGTRWIPKSGLIPGRDLAHFAFVKKTVHKNLFRLTLP